MATIEKIKAEILNYSILKDIIEVEFDDYVLEVNLKYFKDIEINKDTLAEIIYKHYQNRKDN
jgi:hypothetical protein